MTFKIDLYTKHINILHACCLMVFRHNFGQTRTRTLTRILSYTPCTRTHSHEEGGPSSTNQNRIFSLALNNNNMDLGGGRRRVINNRLPHVNRSNVRRTTWPVGGSERRRFCMNEVGDFLFFFTVIGKYICIRYKGTPRGGGAFMVVVVGKN